MDNINREKEVTKGRLIKITDSPLDLVELNRLSQESDGSTGASVLFTGSVRVSEEEHGLTGMTLEHYPGMTENQLTQIVEKAIDRWNLSAVIVVHRVGFLNAGEPIVFVGVSGLHRRECFDGAQFIMDYLKNDATFWKKEHYNINGNVETLWVEAKQSDTDSIKRWQ